MSVGNLPENVILMIRNLGSFDPKVRAQTLAEFRNYIQSPGIPNTFFQHDSLMLIWKGLYDAMLRQAEPLKQEKLAFKISEIVNLLKKQKTAIAFIKAGFLTLAREWYRINQFMRNKMLQLFRYLYRQGLFRLADYRWTFVQDFVNMVEDTMIRTDSKNSEEIPMEARFHLADIYLEELAKSNDEYLTEKRVLIFLKPYIQEMERNSNLMYSSYIKNSIIKYIIDQSDPGISCVNNDEEEETSGEDDADEAIEIEYPLDPRAGSVDVALPQLSVNYNAIADMFMDLEEKASNKKHKMLLSSTLRSLLDVCHGQYPHGTHPSLRQMPVLEDEEKVMRQMEEESISKAIENKEKYKNLPYKKMLKMSIEEKRQESRKFKSLKREVEDHRSQKYKAFGAYKKLKEARSKEKAFQKLAKSTNKMKRNMEKKIALAKIARQIEVSKQAESGEEIKALLKPSYFNSQ